MALIKSIIILIIGFALLMKGADYFVEGRLFQTLAVL